MRFCCVLFFCLFGASFLKAQNPIFTIPAQACLNGDVLIQNNSTGATNYLWDFCQDGLEHSSSVSTVLTIANANILEAIDHASSGGNWYGFTFSRDDQKLLRLDYGNSLANTPVVVDLGNSLSLGTPTQIKIYKEGVNWYALVANFGSNLVRLNFGNSLSNTPTFNNFGNLGGWSSLRGLDIIQDGANVVVFLSSWFDSSLWLVNFGSSITNNPTSGDVSKIASVSANNPFGIGIQSANGNYFALVANYTSGDIFLLNFGGDLFSVPTVSTIANLPNPTEVSFVRDGLNYYGFVENNNGLYRILLGVDPSISSNISGLSLGNFGGTLTGIFGMSITKDVANWMGFFVQTSSNKIQRLSFTDNCSTAGNNINISTTANPINLEYSKSGNYMIGLTAYDAVGNYNYSEQLINIVNTPAPQLSIDVNGNCLGNASNFNGSETSGQTITSWTWDFGDANNLPGQSVTHQYSSTGVYPVTLTAISTNTCSKIIATNLTIFNPPTSSYDLPMPSVVCTNQAYTFTNTSTSDAGSNPTWQWKVNGTPVSTSQDLVQSFATVSNPSIQLIASIPGCFTNSIQSFNIQQVGPSTDFSITGACQTDNIQFTNQTTGSNITGYTWDFGDGHTASSATLTDEQNSYATIGLYNVTLSASNVAGCSNSVTKPLTIYTKPQPDFSLDLPPFSCANSPSQFHDLTPAPTDSNISTWAWGFGDVNNGTGSGKNPTYTYTSAGGFNVSLTVTTNFGCTNTAQKPVTISASPSASFTNTPACINQAVQFADVSTGSIKSRQWKIQNTTYTVPNPTITFNVPDTYVVQLTETGNNNCVNTLIKNIVVPVPPTIDFSVAAPCINNSTVFTELNPGGSDPSASWSWDFGGKGSGTGSPSQFSFSSTGIYSVKMNVTRQSGCVYGLSKSISIGQPPKASFTASTTNGPAPLDVDFTNTSSLADSYLWQFQDANNNTSTAPSPAFTFNDLGTYQVSLTASNILGCTGNYVLPIYVVLPSFDAVMSDFYFVKDPATGSLKAVVSVLNKSNLPITDPEITIDLSGVSAVKEKLTGTILPNQSLIQTLGFEIVPLSAEYACAEIDLTGDTDIFDNKKCVSITGEEILFSPYPNPAQNLINMQWIGTDSKDVRITIYNATGGITYDQVLISPSVGLNQLQINTTLFAAGIYFLQFSDTKNKQTYRFAVSGN